MYAAHEGHLDMVQLLLQYGMLAEVMFTVTAPRWIPPRYWYHCTALLNLIDILALRMLSDWISAASSAPQCG